MPIKHLVFFRDFEAFRLVGQEIMVKETLIVSSLNNFNLFDQCIYMCVSVSLFVPSIYLFICLTFCQSVCPSVYVSVYLYVSPPFV